MALELITFGDFDRQYLAAFNQEVTAKLGTKDWKKPGIAPNGINTDMLTGSNVGEVIKKISTGAEFLIHLPIDKRVYSDFSSSMTYNSLLVQGLMTHSSAIQQDKALQQSMCYFFMLTAHFAYNAAALLYLESPEKNLDSALAALRFGLSYVSRAEDLFFAAMQADPALLQQHETIMGHYQKLMQMMQDKSNYLDAGQLQWLISVKNEKAKYKGSSFNGTVIHQDKSTWVYQLDPNVIQKVLSLVKGAHTGPFERQQVVVYTGMETGHALALDVSFNQETKSVQIICVDSVRTAAQWILLKALQDYCHEQKVPIKMLACQADLQKDGHSCSLYAYYLSAILARTSFAQLDTQTKWHGAMPDFTTPSSEPNMVKQQSLANVQWFDVCALGERAVLANQSFTQAKAQLKRLFPTEQSDTIEKRLRNFNHKHNASANEKFIEVLRRRLVARFHQVPLSKDTESLSKKLSSGQQEASSGLMLRRLAAGFGTQDELEQLLGAVEELDINAPSPDGTTALHWAFKNHHAGRAMLLLEAGANPTLKGGSPSKTPKELCEEQGYASRPFAARMFQ